MASRKQKKTTRVTVVASNAPTRKKKARARTAQSTGLDTYGTDYLKLLYDPCGAALVHPVYPGGDAGFLFRADSVLTVGAGPTETGGFLHWTPGYVNATGTELLIGGAATGSTPMVATVNGGSPGKVFLGVNSFGARCVAACLKISFPGSESSRSGRLHYGHTTAGTVDVTDSVSVDGVAPLLQHYTRTPPEIVELIWRPGVADTEFNDPNATASPQIRDRKSALTVAWVGLPFNSGMTFHFTAVYEWTPRPTTGVSTNTSGKNPSRNTMDNVLDALHRAGFNWVRNAASHAGAGMVFGAASALSNTFGIMPARPTSQTNRLRFS